MMKMLTFGLLLLLFPGVALPAVFQDQFFGINYGAFHKPGQNPGNGTTIPEEQIKDDLGDISNTGFVYLKTYGLDNGLDRVVDLAFQYYPHLKICVGVYESSISHDDDQNPHCTKWQMNRAIELANQFSNVAAIVVGNECLEGDIQGRTDWITVGQLAADLDYVRDGLSVDARDRVVLTSALGWGAAHSVHTQALIANKDKFDIWMINIYPFWADGGIDCTEPAIRGNLDWNYNEFNAIYGSTGKPIVVGEHGWPTAGDDYGKSHPCIENQITYYQVSSQWFAEKGWGSFYFEFFDEPWKINEPHGVGPHWGIYYDNGQPKWPVVNPPPAISVTPETLDFGTIQVGKSKDKTFTVQNTGGGTLSGSATVAGPFRVIEGRAYSLSSAQAHTMTVRYTPTSAGTQTQTVTFTGGGRATREVTGTAHAMKGDIDGDGDLDLSDVLLALRVLAGLAPSGVRNDYMNSGADANGDGEIGIEEVLYILQSVGQFRPLE